MHTKHLTGINYPHSNVHANIALKGNVYHCVPFRQVAQTVSSHTTTETKTLGKSVLIGKVDSC